MQDFCKKVTNVAFPFAACLFNRGRVANQPGKKERKKKEQVYFHKSMLNNLPSEVHRQLPGCLPFTSKPHLLKDKYVTTTQWGNKSYCSKRLLTLYYWRKAKAALIAALPDLKDHRLPKQQVTIRIWNSMSLGRQVRTMNGFPPSWWLALW